MEERQVTTEQWTGGHWGSSFMSCSLVSLHLLKVGTTTHRGRYQSEGGGTVISAILLHSNVTDCDCDYMLLYTIKSTAPFMSFELQYTSICMYVYNPVKRQTNSDNYARMFYIGAIYIMLLVATIQSS